MKSRNELYQEIANGLDLSKIDLNSLSRNELIELAYALELSQIEIISNALLGKSVAYITPTYQLARVFFERLIQAVPFESNKSELTIKFPNGGSVDFFTGERLDNLRGRKFHLVVVDEASFIPNLEGQEPITKQELIDSISNIISESLN